MKMQVKKSIICQGITSFSIETAMNNSYLPVVGDVAIFEVLHIGKHSQIQSDNKCNRYIYPGDHIMAAFGTRYATEQFEGYVPTQVQEEYHILGAGGTVGIIESMHSKFNKVGPTTLKLVGYATDANGAIINTKQFKSKEMKRFSGVMQSMTRIVLSVGASMDSGKTTTAAHMVRGLKRSGMKVGFIKLTGTVYTKDRDLAYDNGADVVTDFGELGFPSTYMCNLTELLDLHESLLAKINANELDYVVIEIADGIYQRETELLLTNSRFMAGVDSVVFSAGDSLSAIQGIRALQDMRICPSALSGLFTASPLLVQEVKKRTNIPIYTIEQLAGSVSASFLEAPLDMTA
jgi:hypothetical protein